MRIFYAAPGTPNEGSLPSSRIWYNNLCLSLIDLGHQVECFAYDFQPFSHHLDPKDPQHANHVSRERTRLSEELLRQVEAAHRRRPIDLFFSYFYSAYVFPDAIRAIKNLGTLTMNWYCNGSYQFHLVEEIAPVYDYCLVPEKFRLEDYRRVGARPIYCQEAANPRIYKPHKVAREYDVTFAGQRYGSRPRFIRRLHDAGIDVRVWGPKWRSPIDERPLWRRIASQVKHLGRPKLDWMIKVPDHLCGPSLSDDDLIRLYSRSKISLGFTTVDGAAKDGDSPIKQVRLRDFEATMSGAFYLVEEYDELADFFEPGKEIVFFKDADDLVDKAAYYLRHDQERERIRAAGIRRARAEHTWQKRFANVFREMGIEPCAA